MCRLNLVWTVSLALALLAGLACDDGGTDPSVPSSLVVSPASAEIELGKDLQFSAEVLDQRGDPIAAEVSWMSSNPAVATVDGAGRVAAVEPGTARIAATFEDLEGAASVQSIDVIPPVAQVAEPTAQASIHDTVAIRIEASDDHRVGSVTLLVDDEVVETLDAAPFVFQWNSLSVPNGLRELRAEAVDASGNRGTSEPVSVLVDNDGWIRVQLAGTNDFTNPFGVRFDNAAPADVPIGGGITSGNLRPGSHLVELPERYVTCAPRDDRLRQVEVVGGDTIEVRFEIGCFVGRAYVSNNLSGVLSIVDSDAPGSVGETSTIGGGLRCIAGLRSHRKAWVVSLLTNQIQVLDTSTDQSLGTVGVTSPRCIAAHEGSGTVMASKSSDEIVFIDPDTDQIVGQIAVTGSPYAIAFDADGSFAYVTHTTVPGRVSVIDTEQRSIVRVLEVGTNPFGIAYDSVRSRLIVSNTGSTTLLAVDPLDGTVLQSANVQVGPRGIALSAGGDRIYVVNSASNTVSVLDGNLGTVATIAVGDDPREVAITSDGQFLVTTNYGSDDLSLVDPVLGQEVRRIPVGDGPNGILLHGGW